MQVVCENRTGRATVAFGPEMPGWGSWEWVGLDFLQELANFYHTCSFRADEVPDADVVVLVKHSLPESWWEAVVRRTKLIYATVDFYAGSSEIDNDYSRLRRCARILVHCRRLRRYFEPYAPWST